MTTEDDQLRRDIALEDYKSWLRELEKQDRWYAQTVWVVVVALGAAITPMRQLTGVDRTIAAFGLWGVGATFVHISATFLRFRVASYWNISRAVAATRQALKTRTSFARDELAGAPLLSNKPDLFRRTTRGRGAFEFLFGVHELALFAIACGALWVLREIPTWEPNPNAALWLVLLAMSHLTFLVVVFRYGVSEAWNLGEFIVTCARDAGVPVLDDAELRLREWLRHPLPSLAEQARPAISTLVSYEDRRYWKWYRGGIDLRSVVAVVIRKRRGGASSIPMQLSRQLLRRFSRSWRRKMFEAILGAYLVRRHGKRIVLNLWLHKIPFGKHSIVGLTQAASAYLGRALGELDELDGLLLGERATVHTGRYYPERVERLAVWAAGRGHITDAQRAAARDRYARMRERVPTLGS